MYKVKNKKLKKARGITLIALVITIIVLLILAGVSIAMLTGPNGLLSQADEARTKTDMSGAKEKVQIEVLGSYGTDGNLDLEELNGNLQNIPGIKKHIKDGEDTELTNENKIEGLPSEVVVDGYIFEISEVGVVTDKGEGSFLTPPIENKIKPGEIVKAEQGNTPYTKNGTAVIPVGFAIVPNLDDVSEGLVISDEPNDTGNIGNQFVWIPVKDANSYKINEDYVTSNLSGKITFDENYLPTGVKVPSEKTEQDVEKDLVTKEGVKGFYISRYEAGDGSATAEGTARTSSSGTTGELVSKKGVYVYNYIKQTEAKEKAKEFTEDGNANVKSGLCTGIQWDMVMAFVNGKNDGGNPSKEFNVTTSASSRHHSGVEQSGQNEVDKVCNIYDLEGNCYEYVAEKNSTRLPYVDRGGIYNNNGSASSHYDNDGLSYNSISFRFVLYVM